MTGESKRWLSEDDVETIHLVVDRMSTERDPLMLARLVDKLRRIVQTDRSVPRAN